MSEHDPWDQTVWDPFNPEQAIEDSMHGPSAVHAMFQHPAMPYGDGTYYQPGAFYAYGTGCLDSQDRPTLHVGSSTASDMRKVAALQEWLIAYRQGGDGALVELEASRQQQRLAETGVARCFKPTDVCPGGKRLENCDTGSAAYKDAQGWAAKNNQEKPGEGTISNTLAWAGRECTECSIVCAAAVMTIRGLPQAIRVSFRKPNPITSVIELDLTGITSPRLSDNPDQIQLARDFYKGIAEISQKDPNSDR